MGEGGIDGWFGAADPRAWGAPSSQRGNDSGPPHRERDGGRGDHPPPAPFTGDPLVGGPLLLPGPFHRAADLDPDLWLDGASVRWTGGVPVAPSLGRDTVFRRFRGDVLPLGEGDEAATERPGLAGPQTLEVSELR